MTHLKVGVRVRPLSQRELTLNSTSIINICEKSIDITNLKVPEQNAGDSRQRVRRFTFDHCFSPDSNQEEVFNVIGKEIEEALKKRHHSCVLAYGQSFTGKTHTMMGTSTEPGLTPRICNNIFSYLQKTAISDDQVDINASVSYLEIYNEKVRDLLEPQCDLNKTEKRLLKVREHPKRGPYVQGLTQHQASDPETLLKWLNVGNSNRRVAATLTNPFSSRSHSVFTLTYLGGIQLHLVDLAGSERAGTRCPTASILKEGANINKSLVALGNVISTLAVSPSSACYTETVNTLRFGQRAKQIVSQPVVNEDPKERTIRELKAEIVRLKELLGHSQPNPCLVESNSPPIENECSEIKNPSNNHNTSKEDNFISSSVQTDLIENKITEDKVPKNLQILNRYNLTNSIRKPHSNTLSSYSDINSLKYNSATCFNQGKLIPLITVNTTTTELKKSSKKLSESSVNNIKMERSKSKSLGSQESLSSKMDKPKKPSLQKRTNTLSRLSTRKSQESISKIGSVDSTNETKQSDTAKKSAAPRKDIIASVTNRLYSSSNKKKEPIPEMSNSPLSQQQPQSLEDNSKDESVISAKVKLLELTRRALKAHRRRHVEIQTDLVTVTRVKDVCTDVNDLQVKLAEIKDVGTEMETVTYKDVGVYCSPHLDSFEQLSNEVGTNTSLILTRSCGTQSVKDQELQSIEMTERKSPVTTGSFSFTKYLQNTDSNNKNTSSSKTFTSSLNINVSRKDSNEKRSVDSTSDDSLDDLNQLQVCFPTPDLISNHNSLETHAHASSATKSENISNKPVEQQNHSKKSEETQSGFPSLFNENFAVSTETCVANCSVTSDIRDKVQSVSVTTLYTPEICITKANNETVRPLKRDIPQAISPNVVEVENNLLRATSRSPEILKSIMKYDQKEEGSLGSDMESSFENTRDSLDWTSKKVRFSGSSLKTEKKMVDAMSKFLEEAAKLMTNLTGVASTMEANCNNSYDIQVTVSDASETLSGSTSRIKRKVSSERRPKRRHHNISTQTSNNTENTSVQTNDTLQYHNRYESILKESCDKLERCIKVGLEKSSRRRRTTSIEREEFLHRFPQPFTCYPGEWNLRNLKEELGVEGGSNQANVEDSSLESNPTFSDYGSLPRQKHVKRPVPSSSPSAYLKQLMRIRRQIVESSREDLLQETKEDSF